MDSGDNEEMDIVRDKMMSKTPEDGPVKALDGKGPFSQFAVSKEKDSISDDMDALIVAKPNLNSWARLKKRSKVSSHLSESAGISGSGGSLESFLGNNDSLDSESSEFGETGTSSDKELTRSLPESGLGDLNDESAIFTDVPNGIFKDNIGEVLVSPITRSDGSINAENVWIINIPYKTLSVDALSNERKRNQIPSFLDIGISNDQSKAYKALLFFIISVWSEHFICQARDDSLKSRSKKRKSEEVDLGDAEVSEERRIFNPASVPHAWFDRVHANIEQIRGLDGKMVGVRLWLFKIDQKLDLDNDATRLMNHIEKLYNKQRGKASSNLRRMWNSPLDHRIAFQIHNYDLYQKALMKTDILTENLRTFSSKRYPYPLTNPMNPLRLGNVFSLQRFLEDSIQQPLFAGDDTLGKCKGFNGGFVGFETHQILPRDIERFPQLDIRSYIDMDNDAIINFHYPCPSMVQELGPNDLDPDLFSKRKIIPHSVALRPPPLSEYTTIPSIPMGIYTSDVLRHDDEDSLDGEDSRRLLDLDEEQTVDRLIEKANVESLDQLVKKQVQMANKLMDGSTVMHRDDNGDIISKWVSAKDDGSYISEIDDEGSELGSNEMHETSVQASLLPGLTDFSLLPEISVDGGPTRRASKKETTFADCDAEKKESISAILREYDIIEDNKHENMRKWDELNAFYAKQQKQVEASIEEVTKFLETNESAMFESIPDENLEAYMSILEEQAKLRKAIPKERREKVAKMREDMATKLWVLMKNWSQHSGRLSGPIKSILQNFSDVSKQNTDLTDFWFNYKIRFKNLGPFGNFIARLTEQMKTTFRIRPSGGNIRHLFNIITAAFSTWNFEIDPESKIPTEDEQMYHYLMAGPAESSKSFLMLIVAFCLVTGTWRDTTHESTHASTVSRGERDLVSFHHEEEESIYGGHGRDGDSSNSSRIVKDRVKGFTTTRRVISKDNVKEGEEKYEAPLTVTMTAETIVGATNSRVGQDQNAAQTRVQIEYKTEEMSPSKIGGFGKIEMHKLITEMNSEEYKKLAAPVKRIISSLQTMYAIASTFVRERNIPPIDTTAYDILVDAVIDEIHSTFGINCKKNSRTIKRGKIMARTWGYINAIYSEYFSPHGVFAHQRNPDTAQRDNPIDPYSITSSLAKRMFVTTEVAIFSISCLQYQLVPMMKDEVRSYLKDFMKRRLPRGVVPSKVSIKEKGYSSRAAVAARIEYWKASKDRSKPPLCELRKSGDIFNPLSDPDYLSFLDIRGKPLFKCVTYEKNSHNNTVTVVYDPNYYHIEVKSREGNFREELAKLLSNECGGAHSPAIIFDKLKEIEDEGTFECEYIYPNRTEIFNGNHPGNIRGISRNFAMDRFSKEWLAKPIGGIGGRNEQFAKKRGLIYDVDRVSHIYHVYILRQMVASLFGKQSIRTVVKRSIENVLRKIPDTQFDILLPQVHFGIDHQKQIAAFPGLLDIVSRSDINIKKKSKSKVSVGKALDKTEKGKERVLSDVQADTSVDDCEKDGKEEDEEDEVGLVIHNQMPYTMACRDVFEDDVSEKLNAVGGTNLKNDRMEAIRYRFRRDGMSLDEYCARRRAERLDIEFDPRVVPVQFLKSLKRIQNEWEVASNANWPPMRQYPKCYRDNINENVRQYIDDQRGSIMDLAIPAECTTKLENKLKSISKSIEKTIEMRNKRKLGTKKAEDIKALENAEKKQFKLLKRVEALMTGSTKKDINHIVVNDPECDAGFSDSTIDDFIIREKDSTTGRDLGMGPEFIIPPDYSILVDRKEGSFLRFDGENTVEDLLNGVALQELIEKIPDKLRFSKIEELECNIRTNLEDTIRKILPHLVAITTSEGHEDEKELHHFDTDPVFDVFRIILSKMSLDHTMYVKMLQEGNQVLEERGKQLREAYQKDVQLREQYGRFLEAQRKYQNEAKNHPSMHNPTRANPDTGQPTKRRKRRRPVNTHARPTHTVLVDKFTGILVELVAAEGADSLKKTKFEKRDPKKFNEIFAIDIRNCTTNYVVFLPNAKHFEEFKKLISERFTFSHDPTYGFTDLRTQAINRCYTIHKIVTELKRKDLDGPKYPKVPMNVRIGIRRNEVWVKATSFAQDCVERTIRGAGEKIEKKLMEMSQGEIPTGKFPRDVVPGNDRTRRKRSYKGDTSKFSPDTGESSVLKLRHEYSKVPTRHSMFPHNTRLRNLLGDKWISNPNSGDPVSQWDTSLRLYPDDHDMELHPRMEAPTVSITPNEAETWDTADIFS